MKNRSSPFYYVAMTIFFVFACTGFSGLAASPDPAKGFETASINIGYMSQDDLGARVGVPELADYIKKLQATCTFFFANATTPENLDIVVAVRSNQESRIWLVTSRASPDSSGPLDQLRAKLEAITPPSLSSGPIAFAIEGRIAGGVPRTDQHTDSPPLPPERTYTPDGAPPEPNANTPIHPPLPSDWVAVLSQQRRSLKFDELLPLVWPASPTSAGSTPAGADDGFTIPQGIRYNKTSDEKNQQAMQLLTTKFTAETKDADVLPMFENHIICGPGLWRDIKNDPALAQLTKGTVSLKEGTVTLQGKLFQSPEEVLTFWHAFKQRTDFTGLKIRRLNPDELKTFWAMISFDIDEPIFILDSPKHKILVNFTSDGKLFWIDDYQNFSVHP